MAHAFPLLGQTCPTDCTRLFKVEKTMFEKLGKLGSYGPQAVKITESFVLAEDGC